MIRIVNDFEGANPSAAEAIEQVEPGVVRVRPYSEDGDGNYKFCLNIRAVNEGIEAEPVRLEIEWDDAEYMGPRDSVLIGWGDAWTRVQGRNEGTVTHVDLSVPPGEWSIGLHPEYDLGAFEADRRRAVDGGFSERVIGKSHAGRDLVALTIGAPPEETDRPTVFITSRFHPYETAGSLCVSGILHMLAETRLAEGAETDEARFAIVPMPNPDGVALGCCKRAREGGPDLCHQRDSLDDPAAVALRAYLDEVKPDVYLDLHGWMYRDHDGLCYTHQAQRDILTGKLADDPLFDKEWKGDDWSARPYHEGDVALRVFHEHGAAAYVMSMSWFGRTVPQMREVGKRIVVAICEILRGA